MHWRSAGRVCIASLAVAVLVGGCVHPWGASGPGRPRSLRELAARRGLLLGTAVDDGPLTGEVDYRRVLGEQFNLVEPENAMKWSIIHPEPGRYDFAAADRLVAFARDHRQRLRGHTLAWRMQNPDWLERGTFTREEAIAILRDHIHTVVGRYRGQIAQWDVVNEALADFPTAANGGWADSPWLRAIGSDYIALAFRFAHEADPTARLYYNDYDGLNPGPKSDRIVDLAADLKRQGVPIDGVGIQFHVFAPLDPAKIAAQMARVRALGLDYAITEADVAIRLPVTAAALQAQADTYGTLLRTCLAAPNCRTFNMWGFTDRHSWIPSFFPGFGAATISDERLNPKPAHDALVAVLQAQPASP